MEKIIENITNPGEPPVNGDWIRTTLKIGNVIISVIESEFHEVA